MTTTMLHALSTVSMAYLRRLATSSCVGSLEEENLAAQEVNRAAKARWQASWRLEYHEEKFPLSPPGCFGPARGHAGRDLVYRAGSGENRRSARQCREHHRYRGCSSPASRVPHAVRAV